MFKKSALVLISGENGSGKTTVSDFFYKYTREKYRTYKYSFSKPVKAMCNYIGWDGIKDEQGRRLLENLTRVGREYNKFCWEKIGFDHLETLPLYPLDFVFVDDWRYIELLEYAKLQVLYIPYKVAIVKDKIMPIGNLPVNEQDFYDYTIYNNSTLENLEAMSKDLIEEIIKIHPKI